jgi:hemoglobin-like flavoprotein
MSDGTDLSIASSTLSVVVGEKQTERACGFCKNAFIMDVDFYVSETDNNQPVCLLCAAEIHRPMVDMLTVWSTRQSRPLNENETLNFNAQALPIVKASFARCSSTNMLDVFYEAMLEEPAIRKIFERRQQNLDTIKHKLRRTLVFLLANAADPDLLHLRLQRVASLHSRSAHSVHPRLYRHFIQAMLQAVAQSDPEYDEDVKKAWLHILPVPVNYFIKHY